MTAREQEELVQRILDGETRPEDVPVFKARFREDPGFRRRYLEHAMLSSCLESLGTSEVRRHRYAWDAVIFRLGRKRLVKSLVWAAAAVLVLLLVGRFIYLRPRMDAETARLAFAGGTRWDLQQTTRQGEPDDPPSPRTMKPDSTLKLEQGVAEVEFPSGVRAWLAGSSQLTYHGKGDFHLDHGKVWFEIPQGANGVVLTTPRIRVVDQGTEFGVISEGAYLDEVHVQTGQVLVQALTGRKEQTVVRAMKAVAVDFVGRIVDHRLDAGVFSRKLPRCLPYLHWSFDALEEGCFATTGVHPRLDTIQAQYRSILATPDEQRRGLGVIGGSVRFVQPGDMAVTSYRGVSGNTPRTLSFWVRVPPDRLRELSGGNWVGMLGWGRRHHPDSAFNESIHAIMGAPHLPIRGKATAPGLVPILSFEGIWYEGETNLADGAWHHLIWSVSGNLGTAETPGVVLYCDGKPESLREGGRDEKRLAHWPPRIDTVVSEDNSSPLTFGGSLIKDMDLSGYFPGELDEVFVIEGAVNPAEARRLFLENRYDPAPPQPIPVVEPENDGKEK
jgi:ferric-dicitrate binding protein FerR (iron transport regulator)